MVQIETIRTTLRGARSKPRNPEAERRNRRLKRKQSVTGKEPVPSGYREQLAKRGLSLTREKKVTFSPESIRGQLLHAVLKNTVYDSLYKAWIFDRSMRDLAIDGLDDGGKHHLGYLLECMADFVRLGILTRLHAKRGRPVVYRVNVLEKVSHGLYVS